MNENDLQVAISYPNNIKEPEPERYRVEPEGWHWVVRAGTGTQVLYSSFFRNSAINFAQRLTTAFNDGRYVAQHSPQGFCYCGNEFSLQRVSGGVSPEGLYGLITCRNEKGEYIDYIRKSLADTAFANAASCTSVNTKLRQLIADLWNIIDDIDTASDIAKSNDSAYRHYVELKQAQRWKTGIRTDGYTLDIDAALESSSQAKEQDIYVANLQSIAELIGSIFVHGNFVAETANEKKLADLLRQTGNFWETVDEYERAHESAQKEDGA